MGRLAHHRKEFIAAHGDGPWPCHFCSAPVANPRDQKFYADSLTVHHLDGDHWNDDPANLSPSHNRCHSRHHATLRWQELPPDRRRLGGVTPQGRAAQLDALARGNETMRRRRETDSAFVAAESERCSEINRRRWANMTEDERRAAMRPLWDGRDVDPQGRARKIAEAWTNERRAAQADRMRAYHARRRAVAARGG